MFFKYILLDVVIAVIVLGAAALGKIGGLEAVICLIGLLLVLEARIKKKSASKAK